MTNPENDGAGDLEQSKLDDSKTTTVDLENPDDSKAQLINANGGAGTDVRFEGTAASSDGEVSFNGLGKEEVMRYADEPFWKRLRIILLVLFWIGWLAMLVTAIIIIAMAPRCPPRADLKWYQTETVYQVMPESFKDSNDDCIGDIPGLEDKMSYLEDLGVNAVWLSNIWKNQYNFTELAITNHREIREYLLANPQKLEDWMKRLQKEGKKVILDLNINQVSKRHEWYTLYLRDPEKNGDYFVMRRGSAAPNNWKIEIGDDVGKPAWVEEPVGYWTYRAFGHRYPDVNLNNTEVVQEVKDIMSFWFSAGVSGFHIKDVEWLVEDTSDEAHGQKHTAATGRLLEELRAVADSFSQKPGRERFLFSTVYDNSGDIASLWGEKGGKRRLHMVMPLMDFFKEDTNAKNMAEKVNGYLSDDAGQWLALGLGNQYVSRIASRVGSQKHKLIPAQALQMLLPGTPFNFYGDEFGQLDGIVEEKQMADLPQAHPWNSPMQWTAGDNSGFCEGTNSQWLKEHGAPAATYKTNNLKNSQGHFDSAVSSYDVFKSLLALRRRESFQWGKTKVCAISDDIFTIHRAAERFPPFVVLMNLGSTEQHVDLASNTQCVGSKTEATVALHSSMPSQVGETISDFHKQSVILQKGDVVVLEFPADQP